MRQGEGRRVYVHEVAPRDGFQIEAAFIPTDRKIALIDQLSRTGLAGIESDLLHFAQGHPRPAGRRGGHAGYPP